MNYIYYKVLLLGFMMLFFSCSNEYDYKFSCDKETNVWVKNNINTIQNLERNDWKNYPTSVSTAMYRAFTGEQKIAFWQDKLHEIKTLPWNADELKHIELVDDFINSHQDLFYVDELTDEQENQLDSFFYKWFLDAEKKLQWNRKLVYAIVCSGYSLANTEGDLLLYNESNMDDNSSIEFLAALENSIPDCNCKKDHVLACFPGPDECQSTDCDQKGGCGWLYMQTCTGKCGFF